MDIYIFNYNIYFNFYFQKVLSQPFHKRPAPFGSVSFADSYPKEGFRPLATEWLRHEVETDHRALIGDGGAIKRRF